MFAITDTATAAIRTRQAFADLKNIFRDANRIFLRNAFDNALLDVTALAVINLARENGFHDLAREMEADFKSETGKEVL